STVRGGMRGAGHEESILIRLGDGDRAGRGPSNVSTTIIRPPQHGQRRALRTTGALRGSVTTLRGRTRSGFSSVTVKKNRSAVMAELIVEGLACCCAICS